MSGEFAKDKEKAFGAILSAIRQHSSVAGLPNAEAFASELADKVIDVVADLASSRESLNRELPPGWHARDKAATSAILNLAHTLQAMNQEELRRWLPESETLSNWAGTQPNVTEFDGGLTIESGPPVPEHDYHEALQRWVLVAVEMATIIEIRNKTSKPKRSQMLPRKYQIRLRIREIAQAWENHFGGAPAVSDNSPFTTIVQAFYECIGDHPPSHPTIKSALENDEPDDHCWLST